jgi:hypothetical protein
MKPKFESSTFWCLCWGGKDLFQTQLKKEAHCCPGQRGRPLILIYLGKKMEKLRIGGKRVSRLNA